MTKWELSKELVSKIEDLKEKLSWEVEDLRNAWDEKSERWQNGGRGTEVSEWLDELEAFLDAFDDVNSKPQS